MLLAVIIPVTLFTDYHLFQLTMVVVYAIAILGLALLIGFNGQISLGHGAFYAIGAYTTAILMSSWDVPYWATLPISAVVCALVGFLIGLPALRLDGLYLALTTFALAVAMPQILKYKAFEDWTGGVQGLVIDKPEAPFGLKLSPDQWLYSFTVAVAVVLYVIAWNIVRGRMGRAMMAIRDHAMAAEAMGINLPMVKTRTFALSAMYTGLAGSLGAIAVQFVAPDSFGVYRLDLPVRRPDRRRRVLHRRHPDRRGLHRVRAQLRRQGLQGRAGRRLWRDPDRGDVPDAGRGRGVPAQLGRKLIRARTHEPDPEAPIDDIEALTHARRRTCPTSRPAPRSQNSPSPAAAARSNRPVTDQPERSEAESRLRAPRAASVLSGLLTDPTPKTGPHIAGFQPNPPHTLKPPRPTPPDPPRQPPPAPPPARAAPPTASAAGTPPAPARNRPMYAPTRSRSA